MGDRSLIEWTDATWNPVTGCTKVSEGCRHCYAERLAPRLKQNFADVILHPDRLDWPLHWKTPRRIFVNSMSDLFHEDVPHGFIVSVFSFMEAAHWHKFQILTKRPERMLEQFRLGLSEKFPVLPNVWIGVSCEDQRTANQRIPLLLQTPAAVRWISAEPLIGPINLEGISSTPVCFNALRPGVLVKERLDWVVVGGESGPGARPMHPDWARSVRDQCVAAGVPFFFKQWGEWFTSPFGDWKKENQHWFCDPAPHGVNMWRVGKKAAGRWLDGREWNEYPHELVPA